MAKKVLFINENELVEMAQLEFGVPATLETKSEMVPGEEEVVCDFVVLHPTSKEVDKVIDTVAQRTGLDKDDILVDVDNETGSTVINVDYIDLKKILEERYNTKLVGDYEVCECTLFANSIVIAFSIL